MKMFILGLALTIIGVSLMSCSFASKPKVVEVEKKPKEEVKFAIRPIADRENGKFKTPELSPDGSPILFKWTAFEDANGHVWYGQRYLHVKELKNYPNKQ